MADTGATKSTFGNLDAEEEKKKETTRIAEETEHHNLKQGLDAEEDLVEEGHHTTEQTEQHDLNQGIDTGTHDSTRHGVKWGAAYQVRGATNRKRDKKDEPDKTSS